MSATSIPDSVALPPGAYTQDTWQAAEPQPYRIILGGDRTIAGHRAVVSPSAVQWADGSVDDGRTEAPHVYAFNLEESNPLTTDQARELAAALLAAADEVDGWVAR
ncbi:hypothetical protein Mycch_2216 [Mycolicibacterium chubuense NBB4]|uniref:Uncharacterized protein n=1 Tax=Mycolicibacterium chubuense (strain NBB4) TaxID=710421 RepID=I4BI92_MYCCN|nr:hypothetical protein [Mycolicibacterium chubuense]AFM16999.1 hypothetical protein Mycch_2216 [Mycolicibacterium chubuense NBB4]